MDGADPFAFLRLGPALPPAEARFAVLSLWSQATMAFLSSLMPVLTEASNSVNGFLSWDRSF